MYSLAAAKRGVEEGRDVDLGDGPLFLGLQKRAQVEQTVQGRAHVVPAPDGVELSVIGAVDIQGRLHPVFVVGEPRPGGRTSRRRRNPGRCRGFPGGRGS